MLTSRERVMRALNHQEADMVPLDLGGCATSGMQISSVYLLRQALGLDARRARRSSWSSRTRCSARSGWTCSKRLAPDVVPLESTRTFFGYHRRDWKPWTLHDGTPMLAVPGSFNTEPEPNGDILQYPEGDKSAPPSGRMPKDGYYSDTIVRQPPVTTIRSRSRTTWKEFGPITPGELAYFEAEAKRLYEQTDKAILANFGGTGFGDSPGARALDEIRRASATRNGMSARHPAAISSTPFSSASARSRWKTWRRFTPSSATA